MRKTLDHTVHTTSGSAAASTSDTPSGTGSSCPAGTRTCSAYPPPASRRADLVADRPAVDTLAQGLDDPADLEPRDVRLAGRRRVVALALQQVGPVDPGGGDPHEHLAGARRGGVDVGEDERVGTAELGEGDRLHAATLRAGPTAVGPLVRVTARRPEPATPAPSARHACRCPVRTSPPGRAPSYGGSVRPSEHRSGARRCRSNAAPSSREPPPSRGEPSSEDRSRGSSPPRPPRSAPRPSAACGPSPTSVTASCACTCRRASPTAPSTTPRRRSTLDDGTVLPGRHDGMAAFPARTAGSRWSATTRSTAPARPSAPR